MAVTGGPLPNSSLTIAFEGAYAGEAIPDLGVTSNLTGGTNPTAVVTTSTVGGVAGTPTLINSVPNSSAALDGNNGSCPRDHRGERSAERLDRVCPEHIA